MNEADFLQQAGRVGHFPKIIGFYCDDFFYFIVIE